MYVYAWLRQVQAQKKETPAAGTARGSKEQIIIRHPYYKGFSGGKQDVVED